MPIDFPTSPATGQTYSYGINRWIYNGVAWDKLDNHPGICGGNQISINYAEGLNGATFTVNVVEGHGSGLDADLLDGVSGERFIENLQTGILYGGLISINAGNTATFDVSAGAGIIVNIGGSTTGYPTPTLTNVSWTAKTGVTTGYLGSTEETFISVNSSGNLVLQSTVWSETQYESQIPIGTLFHHGTGYIDLAISIPHVSYGQAQQFDPFIRAFGPLKLNGYELTGSTADFKIYKSSGKAYLMGRNYAVDPNNPNVVTDTASNPVQYYYMFYRDGSGGFDTTILTTGTDVTNYDDGTGILNSVPSGKYTTQRIFGLPNQPNVLGIYYGREIYNSLEDAKANIQYETFSESESTSTQGVFLGYLVCKANATNLGTTGDHEFIASGLFRNTANIGGGGLAFSALTDLSDVNISSPSNNDALVYDSSTSAWVNKSFSNLPVVTSFNGSTGAIVGVNSVRGLTGAVGITNGSGIGLSVSGQTMTFSNTGVLSIDGGTGAITNVARTNVNNSFSESQTISLINPFLNLEDTNTSNMIQFDVSSKSITFIDNTVDDGVETTLYFNPVGAIGFVNTGITFPSYSTVLAGLAGTQTFTGINTFTSRTNFNSGISASGGITFANDIRVNSLTVGRGAGNVDNNVAIGFNSFDANVTGSNNIAIGYDALGSNTTGNNNAAIGRSALGANTTGTDNVAIGNSSLQNITTSSKNIAIGSDAGRLRANGNVLTSATGGIYIGYNSRGSTLAQTNEIVIGTDALGLGSNTAVIGATSQTAATIYGLLNTPGGISVAGGTFSGTQTFINGATFQGNINAPNIVTSFNGSTGAIVGVNSVRGLTGAVGITNGSGIGLSVSGQTMTFSNTGVLSIDGGTGAITNVARTNVNNNFSASQTISTANAALTIVDSSSFNEVSFQGEFNRLYFYNDLSGGEVFFGPTIAPASTITVALPNYTTTLAGLAGTQTFTGTNTFNALTNFPGGISAAGATFSGNVQAATYTETSNQIRVTNNARSWFL